MRVIVFFDMPTETASDRREYSKFRKFLIKNGFMMMQESVYIKLTLNQTSARLLVDSIKRSKPTVGLVQVLVITEKQFQRIETITGEPNRTVLDSDDGVIIL